MKINTPIFTLEVVGDDDNTYSVWLNVDTFEDAEALIEVIGIADRVLAIGRLIDVGNLPQVKMRMH